MGATQPEPSEMTSGAGGQVEVTRVVARRSSEQGRTMQARLTAVQRALVLLPIASLAFTILARPHPENRAFNGALAEVSAFRASFDRATLEKLLRGYAEAQGVTPLAQIAAGIAPQGGPNVSVAADAAAVEPLSVVSLATLAEAQAHGRADSMIDLGVPDVGGLAQALAWRLIHLQKPEPLTLTAVALRTGDVGDADVALESEIAQLQKAKQEAAAGVEAAQRKLDAEQSLFEARRKNGLAWKIIVKSIEARDAAKASLAEKTQALLDLSTRYDSLVGRALKVPASGGAAHARGSVAEQNSKVPAFAVAHVSFSQDAGVGPFDIPVRIQARQVPVPALRQAEFTRTGDAGLWDKVKDLSPDQAVDAVRAEFNWHNHYIELAGLKLGGMTLLQVLPCLLPLLMLLLRKRLKAAAASYSLFGTKVYGAMPKVGFGNRSLEAIALVVLPIAACLSAGLALLVIDQLPALPSLSAVACLLLGSSAFSRVGELKGLVASVVHSHSYPPPPDPR